jgi:hypothetical protein
MRLSVYHIPFVGLFVAFVVHRRACNAASRAHALYMRYRTPKLLNAARSADGLTWAAFDRAHVGIFSSLAAIAVGWIILVFVR